MVVVLSEDTFVDHNMTNGRELHRIAETARLFGCRVFPIPPNFDVCETAENALAFVPHYDPMVAGLWAGYIPSKQRYSDIYTAALTKGVRLVNSPDEYQTAMEFDHFYPRLGDLTPKSLVLTDLNDLVSVKNQLGFPVFVKGAIKSNKEQGWKACVAHDPSELEAIAQSLLARERRSRGRIVVRQLVKLRTIATDYQDFPLGREYRLFVYQDKVLAYGFYWDEYTDNAQVSPDEAQVIKSLAVEAAHRVGTPFVAVDIGQLANNDWIVIEVGDGQFSGLSQVDVLELWSKLKDISLEV